MRFRNKFILGTGAGQVTGLEIAATFAAEGATVFLNDLAAASVDHALTVLRRRNLKRLVGAPGDIGRPADLDALYRQIAATAKRLAVLVNNAAHTN